MASPSRILILSLIEFAKVSPALPAAWHDETRDMHPLTRSQALRVMRRPFPPSPRHLSAADGSRRSARRAAAQPHFPTRTVLRISPQAAGSSTLKTAFKI